MRNGERIAIKGRDYRLDAVLSSGAGSYGQVWAATDATGRPVAIKLINAEAMTQADPALHGHWRAHLEREIAFLDGLNAEQSRHVIALLDHGEVDGQPALVLERLQANLGQWLAQQRREGALAPDLMQVLDWAEQILNGLEVVHRAGFVYRDLKFSNLLVGENGSRLKLADFGSLKREDGDNTRSFIGTPATMAPEQVLPARRGGEGCEYAVDYRADYYALGLLLFALLTNRPTTAAQRRLGQLLVLHGQEGASQHGVCLGGLDDEERELLRCSIEFWTVPARPEQGGGTAALLVALIDRLLARDPRDRPAEGGEIRAVLDAARASLAVAPILTPDWNAPPPADEPPNRHARRRDRPVLRSRWRWMLLAGATSLAGAVAWAIMRPVGEIGPDRAEPLSAVIAPLAAGPGKPVEAVAPAAEPAAPNLPEKLPVASPEPPTSGGARVAESSEPPASADETPTIADAPVAGASEPPASADESPAVAAAPVAEASEPPASADESPTATEAPVADTLEPSEVPPPVRLAPAKPRPAREPAAKAGRPAAVVATPSRPAAVESRSPARARPTVAARSDRPAPAPVPPIDRPTTSDRPGTSPRLVTAEQPGTSPRPATAGRPVVVDRSPVLPIPPSRIAKPTPPPASAAPESPRRPPVTARVAAPVPRDDGSSKPNTRLKPAPSVVSRPLASNRPDSKSSRPVARAEPPNQIAARPNPAPVLPPIQLASRPSPPPVLPPIQLESRAQSAAPAPPPIELVSRSGTAAPNPYPASVPAAASVQPRPRPRPNSSPRPVQAVDPVTQLRDEAGRAATAVGDWASRTSSTVGKEVRRGLEAADRTVGQWTGSCNQAQGCGRNTTQVERRDRWSDRRGGNKVTQRESSMRYDENQGFARPPPRQPSADYR